MSSPDPDLIDINDIAHQLSLINRFNGATVEPYSVAQHSVIVSNIVNPEFALLGLLHDAAEAYVGDIVHPVKEGIRDFFWEFERPCLSVIFDKYGVGHNPAGLWCVETADMQARATEFRDLFKTPQQHEHLPEPLAYKIEPVGNWKAKRMFLNRFHELTEGRFNYE
ncbi:metal-dependent phosphohydrolase [Gimesia fumaroli]|uniref:metal-dependent phosphohydrolase n=1 Tax=Gimesia fumaroli TaxID=2527976 RepID=UPI0011A71833|nr:metal-dependent phosphohydrolase [Gimesia fumaroli]